MFFFPSFPRIVAWLPADSLGHLFFPFPSILLVPFFLVIDRRQQANHVLRGRALRGNGTVADGVEELRARTEIPEFPGTRRKTRFAELSHLLPLSVCR